MTQVTQEPADLASRVYGRDQIEWRDPRFLSPGLDVPVTKIGDDPRTGHSRFQATPLLAVQVYENGWTSLTVKWIDGEWREFTQPLGHPSLVVKSDVLAEDPTWPWVNA